MTSTQARGRIGLSTYAFFWQWSDRVENPLDLTGMVGRTAELGGDVFQICDYPAIESYDDGQLETLRRHAEGLGVALELGTRGVRGPGLTRYLELARRLDCRLVRSMFNSVDHRPTPDEAVESLAAVVPAFEAAGVTLALETYEQVPTATLVDTVRAVDSPALGICLDPANCIAALERPVDVIDLCAPYVRNVHVKDFQFTRQAGWVGFNLISAPLGTGQLDFDHLVRTVRPADAGISQIVEHWLPWQSDADSTVALERSWTASTLAVLKETSS